mmetsp:Transcript_7447/g.10746  ORF Transcript_7447/g.10746 Transcript_7447/m.10746 type:complete len:182 (+) Transcript_7447:70-615(+)|eukprot:CAMPEP_0194767650 /NCGR_PEP_ID=MMETSP0323_2-20130528/36669_1 /TAXON_ID=2866 ORGANISM="Crypthecodinium cohnii, Strain Seligo" /NCGR_SAMPLE_ID=MMETSP0323_2 /ASSEMBLY_ACC=CAM_ASM_000346 /LENGTH=181 /DNA_ID=CAMNT_0039699511 /DNA_START=31 /DNA_END=576 /DNA_ORIENTATION=+
MEGDNGGDGSPGARPGPRPRGVTGGWGFDAGPSGGGSGPAPARQPDPPTPQAAENKHSRFDGDDDVVPTIPDLEEEAEEDITRQVAAPPTAGPGAFHQPVRSVRELEGALSSRATQLPASPEEGVDLAPLMQCLCSERQVFEADALWDHELVFQEVASAINADLTAAEEHEEDDKDKLPSP